MVIMAKITVNGIREKIADGSKIKDFCEKNGVPFGCEDGICGTCRVKVIKGSENLSPVNKKELDLDCSDNLRLACQCKILQGDVEIAD